MKVKFLSLILIMVMVIGSMSQIIAEKDEKFLPNIVNGHSDHSDDEDDDDTSKDEHVYVLPAGLDTPERQQLVVAKDAALVALEAAKVVYADAKSAYLAAQVEGFDPLSAQALELKAAITSKKALLETALSTYKNTLEALKEYDEVYFESIDDKMMEDDHHHVTLRLTQEQKDQLLAQKAILEEEKVTLQEALAVAEKAYEDGLAASLLPNTTVTSEQLLALKTTFEQAKAALKAKNTEIQNLLVQLRDRIHEEYTEQEKKEYEDASNKIKDKDHKVKVLDSGSIFSNGVAFKFDTPPVIKENRTLIPVRAITEGFGATLTWDPVTQLVTVTKGEIKVELVLGEAKAKITNLTTNEVKEIPLDTKAELLNNRTYVPLRFILEAFKYAITWEPVTETIEIKVVME